MFDLTGAKSSKFISPTQLIGDLREKYGEVFLIVASYAAFPLFVNLDLLCAIRDHFITREIKVPGTTASLVLLSDLFQDIGEDIYLVDGEVRRQLLKDFPPQRLTILGQFLLNYLEKFNNKNSVIPEQIQEQQKLLALTYIKPSEAAQSLAVKLIDAVQEKRISTVLDWAKLIKNLSVPLGKAGFKNVLDYSDRLVNAILEERDLPDFNQLINQLKQAQLQSVEKLQLLKQAMLVEAIPNQVAEAKKSEVCQAFLKKFRIKLKEVELEIVSISSE